MVFYKGDDAHNGDDNDAFYDVRMAVVAEAWCAVLADVAVAAVTVP